MPSRALRRFAVYVAVVAAASPFTPANAHGTCTYQVYSPYGFEGARAQTQAHVFYCTDSHTSYSIDLCAQWHLTPDAPYSTIACKSGSAGAGHGASLWLQGFPCETGFWRSRAVFTVGGHAPRTLHSVDSFLVEVPGVTCIGTGGYQAPTT